MYPRRSLCFVANFSQNTPHLVVSPTSQGLMGLTPGKTKETGVVTLGGCGCFDLPPEGPTSEIIIPHLVQGGEGLPEIYGCALEVIQVVGGRV